MPEFCVIIAGKIFFPNLFLGEARAPVPPPALLRLWVTARNMTCTASDRSVLCDYWFASSAIFIIIRDRLKPLFFLISALAESGAVTEVQLSP